MTGTMCLIKVGRSSLRLDLILLSQHSRFFSLRALVAAKHLPQRMKLNETDVREAFVHGTGPGGQKINKTACAVQLKHLPTGIVTRCQETRSRSQNRRFAWRLLAEKVEAREKGPESRTAIKAEIKTKKKASASKKARRKYRALGQDDEGHDVEVEAVEDSKGGNTAVEVKDESVGEQRVG